MRIAVAGSIATDHLMTFPGRFSESIVPDKLDRLSLSFLVDDLQVRRGGVGANIAFGLGCLGLRPVLVGAVGSDWRDYQSWLERHGVDTASVHVSSVAATARFVCTTDRDANQIASFYPGATSEAREVELRPVADRLGGLDLVLVGADDPEAMVRHTAECRERGYPFAADPSQQLARMDGPDVRTLVEGADYLFTNEYEAALIEQKTGWNGEEILSLVGTRVTTLGPGGVLVQRQGHAPLHVPCAAEKARVDPTGVGDAFRAGFVAGVSWGLSQERSAQVGCLLATYVVETVGTQEYELSTAGFLDRLADNYGSEAADDVTAHLRCPRP